MTLKFKILKYITSLFVLAFLFFYSNLLFSQIHGFVLDENGDRLPYVSIYVDGTTNGTTSSADGNYVLPLADGLYTVVFKYLGYKTVKIPVDLKGKYELNINLQLESIELNELVVSASGEDPAYGIIRQAMAARESHFAPFEQWKCSAYIKGKMTLDSIPPLFYNQMEDEDKKNIDNFKVLYLSETLSDFYFFKPNEFKELIHSSIVSGDAFGFSFNQALGIVINPYEKAISYQRSIVSPIAPNAMSYYDYRLEGSYYEGDYLINKILLLPKNKNISAFSGYIYIVQDQWNIYALDYELDGKRFGSELVTKFQIKMNFVEAQPKKWVLYNQVLDLKGAAIGFTFGGVFTGVFQNYSFDPDKASLNMRKRESVVLLPDSKINNFAYWDSIRPIPLAMDEMKDYRVKDSIFTVVNSPDYKDSIQRVSNKYNPNNLTMGYTYSNWRTKTKIGYEPLMKFSNYNSVQGVTLGTTFFYKYEPEKTVWEWYADVIYGFSNKKLLVSGGIKNRLKNRLPLDIHLYGGRKYFNYDSNFPYTNFETNLYNTFFSINYEALYQKDNIQLSLTGALNPDWRFNFFAEIGERSPLLNSISGSYFKTKRDFMANRPFDRNIHEAAFDSHRFVKVGMEWTLVPFNQYKTTPDRYFMYGSKWPYFKFKYLVWGEDNRRGVAQEFALRIYKDYIDFREKGQSAFQINIGKIISSSSVSELDYRYLGGNESLLKFNINRLDFFRALPNYAYSNDRYVTAHYEHNFNNWIFSRIPLLNKTGFHTLIGLRAMHNESTDYYFEPTIGISNIGWKFIRPLRIEYVPFTITDGIKGDGAIVLGLNFSFL